MLLSSVGHEASVDGTFEKWLSDDLTITSTRPLNHWTTLVSPTIRHALLLFGQLGILLI